MMPQPTTIVDADQRAQATDPHLSFIVQAPAGSGKTEILTQRYLRLLAHVTAPEQIVALTFTKKAANEMRERILSALQQAASGIEARSAHQRQTLAFANQALANDKRHHWQLLNQPNRLSIYTIDALCQRIVKAIPLQEKQIPYATITDLAVQHYQQAATACLEYALEQATYHQPLQILLAHVDNRQDKLIELFEDLLAKRHQWLHPLHAAKQQDRAQFEYALAWIEQHELDRFKQTLTPNCQQMLVCLAQQLAVIENKPSSPRYPLKDWHVFEAINRAQLAALAALLLTTQNTLRRSFDHHVGLKRGTCPDPIYDKLKQESQQLMAELDSLPDFLQALQRVKRLPPPQYSEKQWQVLQALFTLLPLLAAHLHMRFSEHSEVDFTEISSQAISALGQEDSPTDLALYFDYQIHHLLVDEFQDTSIQQFELLSKLVQGWQHDENKTLFVVGDPMQSIYRFRSAEVGLFLRAQQQGIGAIRLIPLTLQCNFRSNASIVQWVNQQFDAIFPQQEDIESGAISFHPSASVLPAWDEPSSAYPAITAIQYADRRQEAQQLIPLIRQELATYPEDRIAILVRSRTQLSAIIQELRRNHIAFQGVDIDLLATLPHLRDVFSLTESLLMPGNRLAWLALLRSPWGGLTLADLLLIANYDKKESIYTALSQLDQIQNLSTEGRLRAQSLYRVMQQALAQRFQQGLVDWLLTTLQALAWEQVLSIEEREELTQYWNLIEQFEANGQIHDLVLFKKELNKLYSQRTTPARLQIMTIHKSKGLEFDCVILPGLSAKSARADNPLMRWLKLPTTQGNLMLVSPLKASQDDACQLYEYVSMLEAEKNHYEQQRLLYVAVTRAKNRLYLLDHKERAASGSFRALLHRQTFLPHVAEAAEIADQAPVLPKLYHVPTTMLSVRQSKGSYSSAHNQLQITTADPIPRYLGVAAHELLQWISTYHPTKPEEIPWSLLDYRLKTMGLSEPQLTIAKTTLQQQVIRMFLDPIGHWILKAHADEQNEYPMLVPGEKSLVTRIIDRTFVTEGFRWIIDFKTGQDSDTTAHQTQVEQYASYLAQCHMEPIRLGLYYLATNQWLSWDYVSPPPR